MKPFTISAAFAEAIAVFAKRRAVDAGGTARNWVEQVRFANRSAIATDGTRAVVVPLDIDASVDVGIWADDLTAAAALCATHDEPCEVCDPFMSCADAPHTAYRRMTITKRGRFVEFAAVKTNRVMLCRPASAFNVKAIDKLSREALQPTSWNFLPEVLAGVTSLMESLPTRRLPVLNTIRLVGVDAAAGNMAVLESMPQSPDDDRPVRIYAMGARYK